MKITVVYGNSRHGSTWHCMDLFKQELSRYNKVEVTEFTLPKDMPHFCNGCFSCIYNGEKTCPHSKFIGPIVEAFEQSNLIVLTSPVYGMDVSGQLKALIDHLCFMWMSHRPNPKMFNKISLTITTTAGAGLSHTSKTMKNSFKFWGVKRIFNFKNAVSAMKWDDVSAERQAKIKKEITKMAAKISRNVNNAEKLSSPFFRSFFFKMMTGMMKKNTWNLTDKNHWEAHGWLKGVNPFKT